MSNVLARPRRKSKSACDGDDDPCATAKPRRPLRTLEDCVDDYIERIRPRHRNERKRYARLASLAEVVRVAAHSMDERGKKLSHQWRIPPGSLARGAELLVKAKLDRERSFDALHERIREVCADVPRFGTLTRYDVACRIGAYLQLEPDRVYLHNGTLEGAKALGLRRKGGITEKHQLPVALRRLRPAEVEDFLCIYKDQLGRFRGAG